MNLMSSLYAYASTYWDKRVYKGNYMYIYDGNDDGSGSVWNYIM